MLRHDFADPFGAASRMAFLGIGIVGIVGIAGVGSVGVPIGGVPVVGLVTVTGKISVLSSRFFFGFGSGAVV